MFHSPGGHDFHTIMENPDSIVAKQPEKQTIVCISSLA